ncbi:DUF1654 domain-containing protein [Pseudomonas knackmussii]|uniref:DUF1654 domain-containing protein n=1 Tax=Pseudomonas knackmussii TaxID=65741 RepID=UPI00136458EC|nr:DUF1654 domain-containing protein [Pseudomonas knackmussii]
MSKQQKKQRPQESRGMSDIDRLRLRISAMINGPRAQSLCQATIWRLESDSDQAWNQVMEELGETDGLVMNENEDGTVTLQWEAAIEDGGAVEEPEPEMVIQRLHEDRIPF